MAGPGKGEVFDFAKTLVGDDAVGMLAKLLWETSEIATFHLKDHMSPLVRTFMSYNAASTAWHIHEWLLKTLPEDRHAELFALVKARSIQDYSVAVQRANGTMAICRQLAIAGKHVSVAHNREDIKSEIHYADVRGRTHATVILHWEGKTYPDYEVYAAALKWWCGIYVALGYRHAEDLAAALAKMSGE